VNALQRRAAVVLQKSTREGFGLTVTEAHMKGAAVIDGNAGGIRRQILVSVDFSAEADSIKLVETDRQNQDSIAGPKPEQHREPLGYAGGSRFGNSITRASRCAHVGQCLSSHKQALQFDLGQWCRRSYQQS
jgi:hypothetical protein